MGENVTQATPDWILIRAEFEAGGDANSVRQLEKRHGPSRMTIARRAEREQWKKPPGFDRTPHTTPAPAIVDEPAPEKSAARPPALAGTLVDPNEDPDAAARVELLGRHRDEWKGARERVYAGLTAHRAATTADGRRAAFDQLKAGKISAEALAIIQANERRAWSIGVDAMPLTGAQIVRVIFGDPYAEPEPASNGTSAAAAVP